jgi:hypothetical protein
MKQVMMVMTAVVMLSGSNALATNCDPAEIGCVNPAHSSSCDQRSNKPLISERKVKPHGLDSQEEKPKTVAGKKNQQ